MIWIILGIIYFIIGMAVSVYTWTEEVDLESEPEDLSIVIMMALVWPILAIRILFNYIVKQYEIKYGTRVLFKRRNNDTTG